MILFIEASSGATGEMLLSAFLELGFPRSRLKKILGALGIPQAGVPSSGRDWLKWAASSRLSPRVKRDLTRVLRALVEAEGKVHRVPPGKVHFHQLARVETMKELAGMCAAVSFFRIKRIHVSSIPMGRRHLDSRGRWRASFGPAARRLLRNFRLNLLPDRFEWTTPTAAAFLVGLATPAPAPAFRVLRIGCGVGRAAPPRALRLLLGKFV